MNAEKIANIINAFRVIPRFLVAVYGVAFFNIIEWFMALEEPTMSQATFVSTIVGAGAAFFGLYVNSGK